MKRLILICLVWCHAGNLLGQDYISHSNYASRIVSIAEPLLPITEFAVVVDTVSDSEVPVEVLAEFIDSQHADSILHALGKQNARLYFKRPAVFTASALGTTLGILTAGITLAVPIALAALPAKVKDKDIPDQYLAQNPSYMAGYTAEAKKRKRITVLKGTGVGVLGAGALVGAFYMMISSLSHI
ncbi:hypothetical protein H9Q13_03480 [Pontibacter sp. JH31]|uniref:Uncharacterized protein n=1 Tax=Pontibacter aquaedesilientis TaxID=2766980 RepID=A0ABR7XD49_9BACT|nr:hypothetical protein [Pontibacter aquaedesilientis]MBD1396216.1 hypothetical protein [Pontibacter aquaedesilientis]